MAKKIIDLTGKKFGKLTVIKNLGKKDPKKGTIWVCICSCGNLKNIPSAKLNSGIKSCGCSQYKKPVKEPENLIGLRFGRLVVIDIDHHGRGWFWKCKCDCGNEKIVRGDRLKNKDYQSCGCLRTNLYNVSPIAKLDLLKNNEKLMKEWNYKKNNNINPNFLTIGSHKRVWWKCQLCGYEWESVVQKRVKKYGCPRCQKINSKSNKDIMEFLIELNISFEPEKRFNNCVDKLCLPFDFFIPDYNLCIEYQGEQHYRPILNFGGFNNYIIIKKHDYIKKEYCKENNINLLEIPYWYKNILKKLILEKIEEIKNAS